MQECEETGMRGGCIARRTRFRRKAANGAPRGGRLYGPICRMTPVEMRTSR